MTKIILITLLTLSVFAQSCRTTKELPTTIKYVNTTDSIVVKNTVYDTMIRVEADSSMIRALIECDSLGQAHIRELLNYKSGNRLSIPTISIKDNILDVVANTKAYELKISLLTKQLEFYKRKITESETTKVVFKTTVWQRFLMWVGGIALALALIFIALKIYR